MLNKFKEKMLYTYVAFRSFWEDKKGADMVEWVGIIALVVGIIVLLSPTARNSISGFFSSVFDRLSKMSAGQP
jgi:Flp pilus assembly pilin Flp